MKRSLRMLEPVQLADLMTGIEERHGCIDILVISAGVSNAPDIARLDLSAYGRPWM